MDIKAIYGAYLKHQDSLRERDENVFHASSAGSCHRKQLYSYYGFPSEQKDDKSFRLLRLGTIVHKDLEEAMSLYEDKLAKMQGEFEKQYGTFDVNIQDGTINYKDNEPSDS